MVARTQDVLDETWAKSIAHTPGTNSVNLLGFACGIGASNPGCEHGPNVLKQIGLTRVLNDRGINAKWKCFLETSTQELDKKLRIDYLTLQYKILAQEVAKTIR